MTKNSTKAWLYKKHRFLKGPLTALVLMSAVLSATAVLFAYFTKLTLDGAQLRHASQFMLGAIVVVSILVFQLVFRAIYHYLMAYYRAFTDKAIKNNLYHEIIHKKQPALDQYHSGQLMNYLVSDVQKISEGLVELIPKFVFLVLRFLFAFILLFFLDVLFAGLMLGFGVLLLFVSIVIRSEIKKRHHAMQDAEARLRSFMQEGLEHVMLIKAFQAEAYTKEHLEINQVDFFKARLAKHRISIFAGTALQGFFAAGYAFAIIYGAYNIGMGVLTFGSLIAIVQLVEYMQSPFSGLSTLLPKYYAMLASAERIMAIEKIPSEAVQESKKDTSFDELAIENLHFSYGDAELFKGLNINIKNHQFIHIKGDSGIGKTTLFKLLLGLIEPTEGSITISTDETQQTIDENTRNYFSYVPQGLMILSGTIKDNIVYNQKDVSEEAIIEAAKVAEIHDVIEVLPNGYNTELKERGKGLSEGQIQRLAIARAILKKAPILLLDEITSALDAETEAQVLKNIKALTDKTCIIISHRPLEESFIDLSISL